MAIDQTVVTPNVVELDFLEVDMSGSGKGSCTACDVAKSRLHQALDIVKPLLAEVGVEMRVKGILVSTEDQARSLDFQGSPTLRLGAVEVVPEHVPGSEGRIWHWAGGKYEAPPVAMFVDAILRGCAIRGQDAPKDFKPYEVPAYLRSYLKSERTVTAALETNASSSDPIDRPFAV